MILLQIGLIPLILLLLLGAIFTVGTAGLEQPAQSSWTDVDDTRSNERLPAMTIGFDQGPFQSPGLDVPGNEQVDLFQSEILHGR